MKLIVPDIHGNIEIVNAVKESRIQEYDKIIFLGDYWDSWTISWERQLECFNEIIKLKKKYSDKIVLLLGNHDIHYMIDTIQYSGYERGLNSDSYKAGVVKLLMEDNIKLFQSAFLYDNCLYTHAGLSDTFFSYLSKIYAKGAIRIDEWLNSFSLENLHTVVTYDGDHAMNNISFIRPNSLTKNLYLDEKVLSQCVGHTHSNKMRIYNKLIIVDSCQLLEIE